MSTKSAEGLLREIIACRNVEASRVDRDIPCHRIVSSQDQPDEPFQFPEPWSGFLETAPILFLSSNPSISYTEAYPVRAPDWPIEKAARFFSHRFHNGWVKDGRYGRFRNGEYSKRRTSYWSSVRQRAIELLERDVVPGEDYCLTEIVHCKSKREVGVREAADECTRLYLRRILAVSGAKVVVVMGAFAAKAVKSQIDFAGTGPVLTPTEKESLKASFAFVPHPAGRGPKEFRKLLGENTLELLKDKLRGQMVSQSVSGVVV